MDTYGVSLDQVQQGLGSLYPSGFGPSTNPTGEAVTSWISAADVFVTLAVRRAAGVNPAATDEAAPLAQLYIIAYTRAEIMRAAYAGRDSTQIAAAAKPYDDQAAQLMTAIKGLGSAAVAGGTVPSRVLGTDVSESRDLAVTDADLGALASSGLTRARRF